MKLRVILLVLSLLAFLSASTGGYLYYTSLKKSAFKEADRQAVARVHAIKKNLSFFLSETIKPVRALAGIEELRNFAKRISQPLRHTRRRRRSRASAAVGHRLSVAFRQESRCTRRFAFAARPCYYRALFSFSPTLL